MLHFGIGIHTTGKIIRKARSAIHENQKNLTKNMVNNSCFLKETSFNYLIIMRGNSFLLAQDVGKDSCNGVALGAGYVDSCNATAGSRPPKAQKPVLVSGTQKATLFDSTSAALLSKDARLHSIRHRNGPLPTVEAWVGNLTHGRV